MQQLIFATNNQGKLKEVKRLSENYDIKVLSLDDTGVQSDPDETGATFEENARIKLTDALPKLKELDAWVAADDSGLTIDHLNGEPGVHSRRWNGTRMTDQEIVDYTLQKLDGVPYERRDASFKSVIAMSHSSNPQAVRIFEGEVRGKILQRADTRQPLDGLPYRQLFFVPETGKMLGETEDINTKDLIDMQLTHRQRAFKKLFSYIRDIGAIEV